MSGNEKKLVKAVEKGDLARFMTLFNEMSEKSVIEASYFPSLPGNEKTIFQAILKCPEPEIVDRILDIGIELSYTQTPCITSIYEDNPLYPNLLKILEHPKTVIRHKFSLYGYDYPDNRAYQLISYLNLKLQKKWAEDSLKAAQRNVIEKPQEIEEVTAKMESLADKLGLEHTESTQDKAKERPTHKKYRMGI